VTLISLKEGAGQEGDEEPTRRGRDVRVSVGSSWTWSKPESSAQPVTLRTGRGEGFVDGERLRASVEAISSDRSPWTVRAGTEARSEVRFRVEDASERFFPTVNVVVGVSSRELEDVKAIEEFTIILPGFNTIVSRWDCERACNAGKSEEVREEIFQGVVEIQEPFTQRKDESSWP